MKRSLRSSFIGAAGAVLMTAGLLVTGTPANASAFCNGWKNTCLGRCPSCGSDCSAKASTCESTGCFTEGAKFGGATHCKPGVNKSNAAAEAPVGGRGRNRGR